MQGTGKGQFIKKGIVEDWRNHFEDQAVENWNKMIEEEFEKNRNY